MGRDGGNEVKQTTRARKHTHTSSAVSKLINTLPCCNVSAAICRPPFGAHQSGRLSDAQHSIIGGRPLAEHADGAHAALPGLAEPRRSGFAAPPKQARANLLTQVHSNSFLPACQMHTCCAVRACHVIPSCVCCRGVAALGELAKPRRQGFAPPPKQARDDLMFVDANAKLALTKHQNYCYFAYLMRCDSVVPCMAVYVDIKVTITHAGLLGIAERRQHCSAPAGAGNSVACCLRVTAPCLQGCKLAVL